METIAVCFLFLIPQVHRAPLTAFSSFSFQGPQLIQCLEIEDQMAWLVSCNLVIELTIPHNVPIGHRIQHLTEDWLHWWLLKSGYSGQERHILAEQGLFKDGKRKVKWSSFLWHSLVPQLHLINVLGMRTQLHQAPNSAVVCRKCNICYIDDFGTFVQKFQDANVF